MRPPVAFTLIAAFVASLACNDASTAAQEARYSAVLSGARVRPTTTKSAATGTAAFNSRGLAVNYELRASGFTTTVTVAHLHIGAATADAGPIAAGLPIIAQAGVIARGNIDLSGFVTFNTLTITGDSLRALLEAGRAYVDVHTAAFPGGELRGQLARQ